LAMTAAAGLTGRLGARIATPRLGLVAGLVFAILPVTSRYAQEARPYACTVLLAVATTYLLVGLIDGYRTARLFGYAATVALLGLSHALALSLLLAHGFLVLALRPGLVKRWLPAAAAGVLPSVPLLWLGYQQRVKINWIATADVHDPLVFLAN